MQQRTLPQYRRQQGPRLRKPPSHLCQCHHCRVLLWVQQAGRLNHQQSPQPVWATVAERWQSRNRWLQGCCHRQPLPTPQLNQVCAQCPRQQQLLSPDPVQTPHLHPHRGSPWDSHRATQRRRREYEMGWRGMQKGDTLVPSRVPTGVPLLTCFSFPPLSSGFACLPFRQIRWDLVR